ncbi:hypothetical protein B9Z55_002652 [Caenorhabditis nigoni]|uniref:Uncharacterized protein n=1 Tax=Caenorhabditis nigoni TaxID=1611254 RepID=A0A2G5VLZ9_9PELO|nr:hypothetical protein B9Z55_002652 [Caenorhabditis nigoni]
MPSYSSFLYILSPYYRVIRRSSSSRPVTCASSSVFLYFFIIFSALDDKKNCRFPRNFPFLLLSHSKSLKRIPESPDDVESAM